ncbi:hypothetical protein SBRCBS47491_009796 [Sporothrix bragantina]|uniref:Arrestin-like N-terminal domain-containing protein n=1 Tax=Sporothrix bragantina TaxID=671064 RepID=A0ABP0D0E8_9PEZI
MKLSLSVSKPLNGDVFQATDKVQGRVDVQLDDLSQTPEVQVLFQGLAKITLKPGFDAKAQVGATPQRHNYKLFSIVQILHLARVDRKTLSASFSFDFPQTAACCGRLGTTKSGVPCPLPPSTLLSTPGAKVRVTYSVTAVCRPPRSSLYHRLLQRTVTEHQSINYAPPIAEQLLYGTQPSPLPPPPVTFLSDDPLLDPGHQLIHSTAWLPASKLGFEDSTDDASNTSASGMTTPESRSPILIPDGLPAYSPAMTLEAVMPNPPTITLGQPVSLNLFLRTPRSLLDAVARTGGRLQLCSLSVRLRRKTQARIGVAKHVDDITWVLWSVNSNVPILQEKVDIACGSVDKDEQQDPRRKKGEGEAGGLHLPESCASAIQGQPGFGACFASRTYTLEVAMGVAVVPASSLSAEKETRKKAIVPADAIQYTRTAIRVMVSEPPPGYDSHARE